MGTEAVPRVRRILETALYVEDLDRAVRFYESVMGLNTMSRGVRLAALDAGEGTVLLLFLRIAEVIATTILDGAVDSSGRLIVPNVPFFGMTAGSGEHYTMGDRVGNIGMTVGRTDIKY